MWHSKRKPRAWSPVAAGVPVPPGSGASAEGVGTAGRQARRGGGEDGAGGQNGEGIVGSGWMGIEGDFGEQNGLSHEGCSGESVDGAVAERGCGGGD